MKKGFIAFWILVVLSLILATWVKGQYKKKYKTKEEITKLTHLDFHYSTSTSMNGWVDYKIDCEYECLLTIKPNDVPEEESQQVEINEIVINKIKRILNKYDVIKWDGFRKSDKNVLDGNDFHLYLTIQNKRKISASGYMVYPENYREVKEELETLFEKYYKK